MATKHLRRDVVRILREFGLADDQTTAADISACSEAAREDRHRVISCVSQGERYIVLINDSVDDDADELLEIIRQEFPNINGSFLPNPQETEFQTLGVRHKFRDTYLFRVNRDVERLDKVMAARYPGLSRSVIQRYIKSGAVNVQGEQIIKPSTTIPVSAHIELHVPKQTNEVTVSINVLYEDNDVIVINKPTGLLTHAKGGIIAERTVADIFRPVTTFGVDTNRPGIVHRLDRDTSGVLIGGKHSAAARLLQQQFADRTVEKTYIAVVDGIVQPAEALIDLPIARHPSHPSTFRVHSTGKSAQTIYKVLSQTARQSLVQLKPKTGRTHQLRVHMAHIGTPITGDRVYGTPGDRLMLHAHQLTLTLPSGERRTFTAPLPDGFSAAFPKANI